MAKTQLTAAMLLVSSPVAGGSVQESEEGGVHTVNTQVGSREDPPAGTEEFGFQNLTVHDSQVEEIQIAF